ncbi:inositol monophosphatase [Nocardioides sp.]|uniref:inositol monophosphatase family protein n=1 Tax=Nocardioides sp. TaxID=35761 RepID=UPI00271CFB47|nr:inositol monophosphatase [Nocardioides sp.]MDO9456959.1 inositol monophosphatase [Nocardioides sp.]
MDTDDITALLQDVAAEVITPRFRSLDADEISEKSPGDLVTIADREAEVLITKALVAAYPEAVVLGEEASAEDASVLERYASAEHSFTVDPVDGTKNFVHGSPDHAVMASELRGGEVVRAWIWQPQHELMYVAERGSGSFRNGERLTTTPPAGPPEGLDVRTSRRSWVGRRLGPFPRLGLSWVSCGIDYPRLAEGACDALLYKSTKPWDHAPGQLLLSEAGGVLLHRGGTAYDPRFTATDWLVAAADRATYDAVDEGWDVT